MIDQVRTMTDAQRRANAAWLRDQLAELNRWLSDNPHRWPHVRIATAHQAILAGDEHWRMRAADAIR